MDSVIEIVNRSNQRGGRMLSVIDLIHADTLSIPQTAWMLQRIMYGSSLIVGARPGGAGKTTIMSALLAMIPTPDRILLTNHGTGWETAGKGDCVVAYEISPGPYDAYIWHDDVRLLLECRRRGARVVTNLHADTLEEARDQIVDTNGADPELFNLLDVFIPITTSGGFMRSSRKVTKCMFFSEEEWRDISLPGSGPKPDPNILDFLEGYPDNAPQTVEAVRTAWLEHMNA